MKREIDPRMFAYALSPEIGKLHDETQRIYDLMHHSRKMLDVAYWLLRRTWDPLSVPFPFDRAQGGRGVIRYE